MWHWVVSNYKWVFDGIGVAIVVAILTALGRTLFRRGRDGESISQRQRGGPGSTNVQIGKIRGDNE
jgi:hypothetical protein